MPTPRSLYVTLPGDTAEALRELSVREFRHPRDQAAVLLLDGLRRAGLLTGETDAVSDQARSRCAAEAIDAKVR